MTPYHTRRFVAVLGALGLLLIALAWTASAQEENPSTPPKPVRFHPVFRLLDAQGQSVLASGAPLSTMQTCGTCHDTAFIESHSFHSDVGLSTWGQTSGHAWDNSTGLFGEWDPLTYRYLSDIDEDRLDLSTAEWIQSLGARHVGGGPATTSRQGQALTDLTPFADDPETSWFNPMSGQRETWDWDESGVVEMNCFLCHMAEPNNEARLEALRTGAFAWANTATLLGSGVVENSAGRLIWNSQAFESDGTLKRNYVTVQDPTSQNCGACHGEVHSETQSPLVLDSCEDNGWTTLTTGQVVSPQKISVSGLNLAGKEALDRVWDVHAERVLECTNCHYALNNPVYDSPDSAETPDHLLFDPRRLDFGEYLRRPLHQFAKGSSPQGDLASEFDDSLRRCEACHTMDAGHEWLPYRQRHAQVMSCETCHVPKLYAPALQSIDWTVLESDGQARRECRGVGDEEDFLVGYQPVLLPSENGDGTSSLAPHNLITAWYWVYGEPERPAPLSALQAAWLANGTYRPEVLALFDSNSDGVLNGEELRLDTPEKQALIADLLSAQGLENPRIKGEVRPYRISHAVIGGEWAVRDCQTCHNADSKVNTPFTLASYTPSGVLPEFLSNGATLLGGDITQNADGTLVYSPRSHSANTSLYILGHDRLPLVDWLGLGALVGVMVGVGGHSTLRVLAARRRGIAHTHVETKQVYMYSIYERQWHWLQTALILSLIGTGLVIHRPDLLGFLGFRYMVEIHNVLAAILIINAALAAFYHVASGEIRQYFPQPSNFFSQAYQQARFYLYGIFRGEPHPFEKTAQHKLNPLQQITYLAILNILLPAQVITGTLMWGAQRFPERSADIGGLTWLGPIHSLIAWLFVAFIVAHVYLTTTGHTPLAGIRAMMLGWDDLEIHTSDHPSEKTE